MHLFPYLALLVVVVFGGNPATDLTNIIPDRSLSHFLVTLNLYCGRIGKSNPFSCSVQLREYNMIFDEDISPKVYVDHNNTNSATIELKGSLYQYSEPSDAFENYIRISCECTFKNGTPDAYIHTEKKDLELPPCPKAKKVCIYDLDIDVSDII